MTTIQKTGIALAIALTLLVVLWRPSERAVVNETEPAKDAPSQFTITTREIKEEIGDPDKGGTGNTSIKILYPEFREAPEGINIALRAVTEDEARAFKEQTTGIDASITSSPLWLNGGYETYGMFPNLISVLFSFSVDTGGAHPNQFYKTLTYDVKQERVMSVADFFNTTPEEALNAVSSYAISDLETQMKSVTGEGDELSEYTRKWINDGAGPKEENFKNFIVDETSLTFYFPPYQVASYAAGSFKVTMPRDGVNQ